LQQQTVPSDSPNPIDSLAFPEFLLHFEATLKHLFHDAYDIDKLSATRGMPDAVWQGILGTNPLSVAIPAKYGGRGSAVKEVLAFLEKASYESLPLSLFFGINIGLFLYPVSRYAQPDFANSIFNKFLTQQHIGGLMITEPGYGSDALSMRTSYTQHAEGYHLEGTKHWQGLSGTANYWLIAARKKMGDGSLGRDIDLFISDQQQDGQKVSVVEDYDNQGLYMIPYGKNNIDINLPSESKLNPHSSGIKMLLDTLHRSRMQFPGMGMGFIERMLDEALKHCSKRMVGLKNLFSMDHVQQQLSRLQAAYTLCSAMCARSSAMSALSEDLSAAGLEANSVKAVVTDLMQECAQITVQLLGANGYRVSNIAGRGIMDSRPFQIFEGSNEMLYTQVAEFIIKQMKQLQEDNLFTFLNTFPLTAASSLLFKDLLDFNVSATLPQRKLLDLGKILSRIICIGYVLDLANNGFRDALVQNCIAMVKQELEGLFASYKSTNTAAVVPHYKEQSDWTKFA